MANGGQAAARAHGTPQDWAEKHLPACLPLVPLIPVPETYPFPAKGERALWAAVLQNALAEATTERPTWARHRLFAREWLFEGEIETGGARWVCDMLDVDYDALCEQLRREELRVRTHRGNNGGHYHKVNGEMLSEISRPMPGPRIYPPKACQHCGDPFTPTGSCAKWCPDCREVMSWTKPRSHHPVKGVRAASG